MHVFLFFTFLHERVSFSNSGGEGLLTMWESGVRLESFSCQEELLHMCWRRAGMLRCWYLNLHLTGVSLPMKWSPGKGARSRRRRSEGIPGEQCWSSTGKTEGRGMPGHNGSWLVLRFLDTTLSFYSSPPLEESVCWRGVLKAAPVKAAIITLRGWTVAA